MYLMFQAFALDTMIICQTNKHKNDNLNVQIVY